jgi:hypothetical protein
LEAASAKNTASFMYGGYIDAFIVHCNIFVALHYKGAAGALTTRLEFDGDVRWIVDLQAPDLY